MVHWWGSAVWWTVRMWRVFEPLVAKIFPQKLHRRSSSENSDIPVIKIRLFYIKIETRSGYYLSNLFRFLFTQNTVSRDFFSIISLLGSVEVAHVHLEGTDTLATFVTQLTKENFPHIFMNVSDVRVQSIPSWVLLSTRWASQVADVA